MLHNNKGTIMFLILNTKQNPYLMVFFLMIIINLTSSKKSNPNTND